MIDDNTSLEILLDIAKKTLDELNKGEEFTVKELFRDFEWKRIAIGKRSRLGKAFYYYYLSGGRESVEKLDKTPQNQQRYRKL